MSGHSTIISILLLRGEKSIICRPDPPDQHYTGHFTGRLSRPGRNPGGASGHGANRADREPVLGFARHRRRAVGDRRP